MSDDELGSLIYQVRADLRDARCSEPAYAHNALAKGGIRLLRACEPRSPSMRTKTRRELAGILSDSLEGVLTNTAYRKHFKDMDWGGN